MLYVGVDAHKSASQLRVVDELGEVVDRRRVASTTGRRWSVPWKATPGSR